MRSGGTLLIATVMLHRVLLAAARRRARGNAAALAGALQRKSPATTVASYRAAATTPLFSRIQINETVTAPLPPIRELDTTNLRAAHDDALEVVTAAASLAVADRSAKASTNLPPDVHQPGKTGVAMVDSLNAALYAYPLTTSVAYLYHNPVIAAALCATGLAAGVPVPVEMGPAFLLNSALRRFRVPFVVGVAAVVVRLAPSLAQVRVSALVTGAFGSFFGSLNTKLPVTVIAPDAELSYASRGLELLRAANPLDPHSAISTLMDRYGLAYVLTARFTSSATLISIAAALHYGVNLSALLAPLGIDGGGGSADTASGEWLMDNVCFALVAQIGLFVRV